MRALMVLCLVSWGSYLGGAEVVPSFTLCGQYFYKSTPPSWFLYMEQVEICQRLENDYYYASLYHPPSRIPFWSAYILQRGGQPHESRITTWYVEPQVSIPDGNPSMKLLSDSGIPRATLKERQAINADYSNTGFNRGHLSPFSYATGAGQKATCTLTNAAPMDPCFNTIKWANLEKYLKSQLMAECEGTSYLVTGTVPDQNRKIPIWTDGSEGDRETDYDRVTVPSHVWTAVCCDHWDQNRKFSFAFLGENHEEANLQHMSVAELEDQLRSLYARSSLGRIFIDDCGADNEKAKSVLSTIWREVYRSVPVWVSDKYSHVGTAEKRRKMNDGISKVMGSNNIEQNNVELENLDLSVIFSGMSEWHKSYKGLIEKEGLACVLSKQELTLVGKQQNQQPMCTIQEPKDIGNSQITADGFTCVGHTCGKQGYAYSWCYYTQSQKGWDYCCLSRCENIGSVGYRCWSGEDTVACSPQYSTVTVKGSSCRADHPCAKYGQSYYWCYTDINKNWEYNWEYCCSPRNYCGSHTYNYLWCYTEDSGSSWEYCQL